MHHESFHIQIRFYLMLPIIPCIFSMVTRIVSSRISYSFRMIQRFFRRYRLSTRFNTGKVLHPHARPVPPSALHGCPRDVEWVFMMPRYFDEFSRYEMIGECLLRRSSRRHLSVFHRYWLLHFVLYVRSRSILLFRKNFSVFPGVITR